MNTSIDINQINQMVSSWKSNAAGRVASTDPELVAALDALAQTTLGRKVPGLSATGKSTFDVLGGIASQAVGKSDAAVAGFGSLNDLIASMPMRIESPYGQGISRGVGINSLSIAQQIVQDIQKRSTLTNGYDGLSVSLATGAAESLIRDSGDIGQVNNVELANSSAQLKEQIKGLIKGGNLREGSTTETQLSRIAKLMDVMEESNVAVGNISEGMSSKLKEVYGFTEEEILAADKTRAGKMSTTFLDASAENKLKDGIKQYTETLKIMSELFRSDDFQQLEQQAKQFGIRSMTTKQGADKVKSLTRTAINAALITGQTTDEVLTDMGAIASVTALTNGGKASLADTTHIYNVINEARTTEQLGITPSYSAEEKVSIAANQIAEANEEMLPIYAAQEAMRRADRLGQLSPEDKDKFNAMNRRLKDIAKLDPSERMKAFTSARNEIAKFAESYGYDLSDPNLRRDAAANREEDLTKFFSSDINGYTQIQHAMSDRFAKNKNLNKGRLSSVVQATDIVRKTLGGDDAAMDNFMKLSSATATGKMSGEDYMAKLVEMGFDEMDAVTLYDKKLSVAELNTMNQVRNDRRQNFQFKGSAQEKREKEEESARILAQMQDLHKYKNKSNNIIAGLIDTGGAKTDEEVIAEKLLEGFDNDLVLKYKAGKNGVLSYSEDDFKKIDEIFGIKFSGSMESAEDLEMLNSLIEQKAKELGINVSKDEGGLRVSGKGGRYKKNAKGDKYFGGTGARVDANGAIIYKEAALKDSNLKTIAKNLGINTDDVAAFNSFKDDYSKALSEGTVADLNSVIDKYSEGKSKLVTTEDGGLYFTKHDADLGKPKLTDELIEGNKLVGYIAEAKGISPDRVKVDENLYTTSEIVDEKGIADFRSSNVRDMKRDFHRELMTDKKFIQTMIERSKSGDTMAAKVLDILHEDSDLNNPNRENSFWYEQSSLELTEDELALLDDEEYGSTREERAQKLLKDLILKNSKDGKLTRNILGRKEGSPTTGVFIFEQEAEALLSEAERDKRHYKHKSLVKNYNESLAEINAYLKEKDEKAKKGEEGSGGVAGAAPEKAGKSPIEDLLEQIFNMLRDAIKQYQTQPGLH